jgi:hypothetical protein
MKPRIQLLNLDLLELEQVWTSKPNQELKPELA